MLTQTSHCSHLLTTANEYELAKIDDDTEKNTKNSRLESSSYTSLPQYFSISGLKEDEISIERPLKHDHLNRRRKIPNSINSSTAKHMNKIIPDEKSRPKNTFFPFPFFDRFHDQYQIWNALFCVYSVSK